MAVIDIHTHMLTRDYLELLRKEGGSKYSTGVNSAGQEVICRYDAPFMTLTEPMWDYDARIRDMDAAGVDVAVVSLT